MAQFLDTSIEYLKGVGPKRADLLKKELHIFTFKDLILFFPFRYIDRSRFYKIAEIKGEMPQVKHKGKIIAIEVDSGDYFMAETVREAGFQAKAKYPDKVFHFVRVGHRAVRKKR